MRCLLVQGTPKAFGMQEKTYVVYLNPFLIREESEKIISQKYNKQNYTEEAWEEILSEELENYEVSPGRQAVASKALGLINRSILSKDVHLSNAMSSITLRLTDSEYAKLKDSKEVTLINEVPKFEMEPSFPYHDFSHGGELVSWAKAAVNANDTRTTRNPFYFADLHPMYLQNTSEYNINLIYSTGVDPSYIYHSSAIALIVSGNRNSRLGRGINPGQPLFLTGTGGAEPAAYSHRGGISSRRSQRY